MTFADAIKIFISWLPLLGQLYEAVDGDKAAARRELRRIMRDKATRRRARVEAKRGKK
jgi:hypothetical protein